MLPTIITPILQILDKIIPDPKAREEAKLNLLRAENQQSLEEIRTQLSAILAEAQSPDPWTSRARPSFLYVVYTLLLASLPMGIVQAISPHTADAITNGFRLWLLAIPDNITDLFSVVMLGYIGGRSWEKVKGRK